MIIPSMNNGFVSPFFFNRQWIVIHYPVSLLTAKIFLALVIGQFLFIASVAANEKIIQIFPDILTPDTHLAVNDEIKEGEGVQPIKERTMKESENKIEIKKTENINEKSTSKNNTNENAEKEIKTPSLLAPSKNPSTVPDVTESIMKVSGGLLLVIVAIFGSAWFYRRFGNLSPVANDSLKVIGGLTIGQKEKIVLIQVGDEQVLIGVAPGNIQKIHVLENPIKLNGDAEKETNVFSDQLDRALGQWKKTS